MIMTSGIHRKVLVVALMVILLSSATPASDSRSKGVETVQNIFGKRISYKLNENFVPTNVHENSIFTARTGLIFKALFSTTNRHEKILLTIRISINSTELLSKISMVANTT